MARFGLPSVPGRAAASLLVVAPECRVREQFGSLPAFEGTILIPPRHFRERNCSHDPPLGSECAPLPGRPAAASLPYTDAASGPRSPHACIRLAVLEAHSPNPRWLNTVRIIQVHADVHRPPVPQRSDHIESSDAAGARGQELGPIDTCSVLLGNNSSTQTA